MIFFSSRHKKSSHDSLLLLILLSSVFPSAPYVTLSREGYSIEEEFLAQAGVRIEKNFEIYGERHRLVVPGSDGDQLQVLL